MAEKKDWPEWMYLPDPLPPWFHEKFNILPNQVYPKPGENKFGIKIDKKGKKGPMVDNRTSVGDVNTAGGNQS